MNLMAGSKCERRSASASSGISMWRNGRVACLGASSPSHRLRIAPTPPTFNASSVAWSSAQSPPENPTTLVSYTTDNPILVGGGGGGSSVTVFWFSNRGFFALGDPSMGLTEGENHGQVCRMILETEWSVFFPKRKFERKERSIGRRIRIQILHCKGDSV